MARIPLKPLIIIMYIITDFRRNIKYALSGGKKR